MKPKNLKKFKTDKINILKTIDQLTALNKAFNPFEKNLFRFFINQKNSYE